MGKCIYVDNSNVWIEGKYHSAVEKGMVTNIYDAHNNKICDMPWAYDFGKLLGQHRINAKNRIIQWVPNKNCE